jgi:hypothetical protein
MCTADDNARGHHAALITHPAALTKKGCNGRFRPDAATLVLCSSADPAICQDPGLSTNRARTQRHLLARSTALARFRTYLLSRCCRGLGERTLAGYPLLDGDDGSPPIAINHRDVEPGSLLEKLDIALYIGLDR